MANITNEMLEDLYKILVSIKTKEDCKALLGDLCTYKEVENMAQRLRAAKLLINGETYNMVTEKTGIATATLARVSDAVKHGNGYKKVFNKD